MSVLLPSRQAIPGRVKGRIWGNLAGARAFACCTACCRAVCCPIWGFSAALAWAFRPPMAGRRCLTPWAPCPSWWEPWACPAWCSSGWATTPWAPYTPGPWTGWPAPPGGAAARRQLNAVRNAAHRGITAGGVVFVAGGPVQVLAG
ncbi:MAG: hypothetical protein ACLS43_13010 [Evtepia gabavorous]